MTLGIVKSHLLIPLKRQDENVDEMESGESTDQEESYDIGEYVVAMYENSW